MFTAGVGFLTAIFIAMCDTRLFDSGLPYAVQEPDELNLATEASNNDVEANEMQSDKFLDMDIQNSATPDEQVNVEPEPTIESTKTYSSDSQIDFDSKVDSKPLASTDAPANDTQSEDDDSQHDNPTSDYKNRNNSMLPQISTTKAPDVNGLLRAVDTQYMDDSIGPSGAPFLNDTNERTRNRLTSTTKSSNQRDKKLNVSRDTDHSNMSRDPSEKELNSNITGNTTQLVHMASVELSNYGEKEISNGEEEVNVNLATQDPLRDAELGVSEDDVLNVNSTNYNASSKEELNTRVHINQNGLSEEEYKFRMHSNEKLNQTRDTRSNGSDTHTKKATLLSEVKRVVLNSSLSTGDDPDEDEDSRMNSFAFQLPDFNGSDHDILLTNETEWGEEFENKLQQDDENIIYDPCMIIAENIHRYLDVNVTKDQVQAMLRKFHFLLRRDTEDIAALKNLLMRCVETTEAKPQNLEIDCIQLHTVINSACKELEGCKEDIFLKKIAHGILEILDEDMLSEVMLMIRVCAEQA